MNININVCPSRIVKPPFCYICSVKRAVLKSSTEYKWQDDKPDLIPERTE